MQVATLFRDNVLLLGSASTMNTTSESTLTSLEEEEEATKKIFAKDTRIVTNNLPLSVSSLVSLASTALLGNENITKPEDIVKNVDKNNRKKEEKEKKDQNFSIDTNISDKDNLAPVSRNELEDRKESAIINEQVSQPAYAVTSVSHVNLNEEESKPAYDGTSGSHSSSLLDLKERECGATVRPSSPPLKCSLVRCETESKTYISNFNDSEASNHVPSSQTMLLADNESSFKTTFIAHEQNLSESIQTQKNDSSSSMTASNLRETHGCATNNISDMVEIEAENLVIHQHDHSNSVPRKTSSNDSEMDSLLQSQKEQCDQKQEMDIEESLDQHAHQQQMEFNRQPISQQQQLSHQRLSPPEERNEVVDNCSKHNQYSHAHQFHECLRNDLNGGELSQQSVREQQMSQNSLDSNVEDYRKLQHLPSNMNMINQVDHQHQYHHLNHNQQLHQHAQQLYLQHHDQQHMIHQHTQQQHHSELMAYLHHQDQQAMQQPHHIRTYQHYQQQQQRIHQIPHPQPSSPHHQQKHASMTCIDDLMIDEFHDDPNNRYKLLSPTVKHESQDDGYETSAGDVLTPNSHSSSHSMTPQHQIPPTNLVPPKCEDMSSTHHTDPDPYNFIDDEINSNIRMMSPSSSNGISMVLRQQNYGSSPEATRLLIEDGQGSVRIGNQQIVNTSNAHRMQVSNSDEVTGDIITPKKRGRKKKCAEEISTRTMVDGILKPILQKERKKHDRFNGMPEEEVSKRTLPDHLADNLDIIIIGINPGLFAAYKGHHYAGPGNHFWKCLYLSGLTHEQMTAEEDYKLLKFGIGFTNMVERATKGSADLTRKEIKEGSRILLEKLKRFRPKIAVFNGKLIFEVFSGKKDFNFGRQHECVEGTDTYMWVMPSSSARCAQLPRAADKVPFYAALKKFRDYLNGLIPHIDDLECVFNDPKSKQCCESESKGDSSPVTGPFLAPDCLNSENQGLGYNNSNSSTPERGSITDLSTSLNNNNSMNIMHKVSPMQSVISSVDNSGACGMVLSGINLPNPMNLCNSVMHMPCNLEQSGQPEKKKRGRPKKIKGVDGEDGPIPQKVRNMNSMVNNNNNILNLTLMGENGETPKKKRGRPKKIKTEIGNSSNLGSNIAASNSSSSSSNNGRVSANNPMDNNSVCATKTDICLRNSPSGLGNHQILTMNNSNQFNSQTLSQQQPLQNQRLFSSPMHSPNTVSSYCPMGMNAPPTPPTGNTNSNNSNLGSSGSYHQQQLGSSHHLQPHQHNHVLQRVQHQLHILPGMYMPSPNHNPQQSSKSPHYGSSHSDLSTEISAAISSEHLGESQSVTSPAMGAVDYDRPDSIPNEEHSGHDLRFASPTSNAGDPQQSSASTHQIQHYHTIYQNPSSNQAYLSANSNSVLGSTPGETGGTNPNNDSINYIVSNRPNTSNSNTSTPQPTQIQAQQRNLQISDVTSKSLSGLESLVDQIPTIAENESPNSLSTAVGSAECRIKTDSNEGFPSPASGGSGTGSSISGGLGCIYLPSYSNLNSSSSSSPSSAAPSNSSILSPHHYPDPIYSTANTCPSATNTNSNNNINYNGLASNFSVSSLTSNNYPANSYHTNLMTAASSPHHIASTTSGSPMYMDPHMPVAVSPIYHHPYAQHAGYGAYSPVGPPPPPPPPTLHMPSPNYPYSYTNASGYPSQSAHHPSHTSATGYLTNHPSMFDRIKPDIGYGGY